VPGAGHPDTPRSRNNHRRLPAVRGPGPGHPAVQADPGRQRAGAGRRPPPKQRSCAAISPRRASIVSSARPAYVPPPKAADMSEAGSMEPAIWAAPLPRRAPCVVNRTIHDMINFWLPGTGTPIPARRALKNVLRSLPAAARDPVHERGENRPGPPPQGQGPGRRPPARLRPRRLHGPPCRGMRHQPAQTQPRRGHPPRQARRPLRSHRLHRRDQRMALTPL
jgi:hypothetical protein